MSDKPVTLAAITGAHGVAGEVRLKLFGEGWEQLRSHPSFNDGALKLAKVRSDNKGGAIARFEGVSNRNEAEALRGTALTVPRDALPPLEEGEYYHADLIGLPVVTEQGEAIGTVADVMNYGATDLVEIERADGRKFMVPLTEQAVPEWNDERLVVNAAFAED
ncbi:MAG: ribosome maturation factor RimM [Sphingomonadaceae bacterium]